MTLDRVAVAIPLIPAAAWVIFLGGPLYNLVILAILVVAAREYARMFRASGQRPAGPLLLAGVPLIAASHGLGLGALAPGALFAVLIAAGLAWHLIDFERGWQAAGTDFALTLGGLVYLGWMGGYWLALRALPDGLWWSATLFGSIWIADGAAYGVGRWLGRHAMAPRLSPRKTWEGYAGGVLGSALGAAALAACWGLAAGPGSAVGWPAGLALGALAGLTGPLGDLGISMMKRQTGVKDSGHVLAGHGGALDRVDSWLIAVPLGYYAVLALQAWLR